MSVLGLDHVQLAAPAGCELAARRFFGELLGLAEIEKPPALAGRGGVWFVVGAQQPRRKKHGLEHVERLGSLLTLEHPRRLRGVAHLGGPQLLFSDDGAKRHSHKCIAPAPRENVERDDTDEGQREDGRQDSEAPRRWLGGVCPLQRHPRAGGRGLVSADERLVQTPTFPIIAIYSVRWCVYLGPLRCS
jgi:catechol 2,3-dioxygenase-like lactoylglutathione lyase family enzyme